MPILKIIIQCISISRAALMFVFIIYYKKLNIEINTFILVTAFLSDIADGHLARKYKLTTLGGKLLDLFSDKYLTCIIIIFLIIEDYCLFSLLLILTKEIFIISFRSITIEGHSLIITNRLIGGFLAGALWITSILHINNIFLNYINIYIFVLGLFNFVYFAFKIYINISSLKEIFKTIEN